LKIIDTALPDVKIIEPKVFGDERGFFLESWNAAAFAQLGLHIQFVQDNHSRSAQGTLRGLHYQVKQTQGKLVRVTHGCVLDVVVDLRRKSPMFGKHVAVELSGENKKMVWVPPGFAHGFHVLSTSADFLYKASDYYAPEFERSLLWSDPALAIDWRLDPGQAPILAAKDARGTPLASCDDFEY
jgi:dTDP-4-dehydrorhamnose 3,5-epimerase